ncbi:MAG: DUF4375 domain-containing protein [Bacteroidetes bacterium]|nr:DUF4375 domain-containing protein [Bacteroidota bacterium]
MKSKFLPTIEEAKLNEVVASGNQLDLYDLLVQPLHEEMYKRQTFEFMNELSEGQQLLLSYDYVQTQVLQGGFIQFIQNGYVSLLLSLPGWLEDIGANDMSKVIDDVLKVYVLNRERLDAETSVEDFAKLYNEFTEFEILDKEFAELNDETIQQILDYALEAIEDFAVVK